MKKIIYLSLIAFFSITTALSQAPQKFNYQAVARDNAGNPLSNKLISIRISILNTSPNGIEVYKETFLISTNEFGHFNVAIGSGSPVLGNIAGVNWDAEDKYLKVELDATGGSNYVLMGATQLLSVPYALNARYTSNLATNAKINLDQINGNGAINGQIIVWNGTKWVPSNLSNLSGDNWGNQSVQTGTTLTGNGTTASKLNLAQQGATSGQVLQWNGTTWAPATIATGGNDNWGTQTATTSGALSGNGTSGNPIILSQQGATSGQVLKWNGTTWVPANETGSDNWGTQVASTNTTLTGDGTSGNPMGIAQQGATTGQVLKWNGTAWTPANETGSDNWGTQTATTNATLSGNGTSGNPLAIAQQGAANGQVLQWNGTIWAPATITGGVGDNWGTQVVQTNTTLTGNGTSSTPLALAQQGATTGQLLQWNGTAWVPVTLTGDNWGTQTAVTSGAISGNGTTATPIILAQQGATNNQVLKWNGTAWTPKNDSLGWGSQVAQTNATLAGNGTSANPLKLAQQSAINGQVLKWNNTSNTWIPSDDMGYDDWGTQTVVRNATLTGNGTTTTPLALAQQGATNGQVLKWNGTTWLPANDSIGTGGSGGSYTANNGLTLTGSNFALGGTLLGATVINTTQTNNLALTGLWTGFDDDSILTSNAANGIINRQHRDRVNYWRKDASSNISYSAGKVSIGNTVPKAKFYLEHNTTISDTTAYIVTNSTATTGNTSLIIDNINTTLSSGVGVSSTAGFIGLRGRAIGTANSAAGQHTGVHGFASGNTLGTTYGVTGAADTSGFSVGMRGNGGTAGMVANVLVENTNSGTIPFASFSPLKSSVIGYTAGNNLIFSNSNIGVIGVANSSNTYLNCGINGVAKAPLNGSNSSNAIGVTGEAYGGDTYQVGVYGFIDTPYYTGSIKRSGLFSDTFEILGTIKKTSGTFRIDHPLDPANKYLDHSFVESPDMMNIYNGNVVTDSRGMATIQLPSYFMALNKDFRYQLTAIGEFAQVIVKEKIKDNKFVIQSDKPNIEVSWQITGIRNDPYAVKNRIVDEVEKTGVAKGKYLYPELYNQPAEKGIYYQLRKESRPKVEDNNTWDKIKNVEPIR